MNRWTDLLASFGLALLLHGLLVLGAVWFWTLRPPELRPVFQGGDVSLAVTFVAVADKGQTTEDRRQPEEDARRQTPDDGPKRMTATATEPPPEEAEDHDMLDAQTVVAVSAKASANAPEDDLPTAKAGRQLEEDAGRQTPDASLKQTPATIAEPPSDALRQGVSGAVRMQSEIRPYYPLGARLRGEEGAVTVRVWVQPSGRARRCEVARSSGYPVLDESAVDAARRARYVSTRPGAWRTEAETTLTFRFRLTE
ncbi:MAG: energy transducer TonB [Kiritimatiellaeota bacterium]|nr:energy transducer TonB [Kiritimatiellota bacterium]